MGVLEESLGVRPWGLPAWLTLLALACRLRRRPFVLLDVGAEPASDPLTRRLFVATARLATHVSVRDSWSAESLHAAGLHRALIIAPDLAFAHPCPRDTAPEPGLVAVGVMAYYGRRGDPVTGTPLRQAYVNTLTTALLRLLDDGFRLMLLGGDLLDTEVTDELADVLARARPDLPPGRVTVPPFTTFTEVSAALARAEVVVASRFHTLIAALRLRRPTVSVGYSAKSARLLRSLHLEDYHTGIEDLDATWLVDRVHRARREAGELTGRLDDAVGDHTAQVLDLLRRVARHDLRLPVPPPVPPPVPRTGHQDDPSEDRTPA